MKINWDFLGCRGGGGCAKQKSFRGGSMDISGTVHLRSKFLLHNKCKIIQSLVRNFPNHLQTSTTTLWIFYKTSRQVHYLDN